MTMTHERSIPVLKTAPAKLVSILSCAYEHPFDREGFKECVLHLFPGRDEKSVFRGMAIPTLRRLGLIMGYEDMIRVSANGALLAESAQRSPIEGLHTLRLLLFEMDSEGPLILGMVAKHGGVIRQDLETEALSALQNLGKNQATERIRDWLRYLTYSSLIEDKSKKLNINKASYDAAITDASLANKEEMFQSVFFCSYNKISSQQHGIMSVDIAELRLRVILKYYKEHGYRVTEKQFDSMLSRLEKVTNQYTISFGRPMGTTEKLFILDGVYYQTIVVRYSEGSGNAQKKDVS